MFEPKRKNERLPKFSSPDRGLEAALNLIVAAVNAIEMPDVRLLGGTQQWTGRSVLLRPDPVREASTTDCTPWRPTFSTVSGVSKVKFDVGKIGGLLATNWDALLTVAVPNDQYYLIATVSYAGGSGAVSSFTLSLASAVPAASDLDPVNMSTAPASQKIILGAIKNGTYCMAYETHLLCVPVVKLTTSKASVPAAGLEPFDRWWGWSVYSDNYSP